MTLVIGLSLGPAHASVIADSVRAKNATVSVLHALPQGASAVDIYIGQRQIIDDLAPGKLQTVQVPSGRADIVVMPSGERPGTTPALLTKSGADIDGGTNMTITANLDDAGKPELNVFTNKTRTVGQGMGRLTIRHIADAPAIDVRSRGNTMFERVTNSESLDTGLRAGRYSLRVSETGVPRPPLTRTEVEIRNKPGRSDMGNNVIVYVWGDSEQGRVRTAVQEVQLDLN